MGRRRPACTLALCVWLAWIACARAAQCPTAAEFESLSDQLADRSLLLAECKADLLELQRAAAALKGRAQDCPQCPQCPVSGEAEGRAAAGRLPPLRAPTAANRLPHRPLPNP